MRGGETNRSLMQLQTSVHTMPCAGRTVYAGRYGCKNEDKQEVEAEESHARGLLGPSQKEQEGRVRDDAAGKQLCSNALHDKTCTPLTSSNAVATGMHLRVMRGCTHTRQQLSPNLGINVDGGAPGSLEGVYVRQVRMSAISETMM